MVAAPAGSASARSSAFRSGISSKSGARTSRAIASRSSLDDVADPRRLRGRIFMASNHGDVTTEDEAKLDRDPRSGLHPPSPGERLIASRCSTRHGSIEMARASHPHPHRPARGVHRVLRERGFAIAIRGAARHGVHDRAHGPDRVQRRRRRDPRPLALHRRGSDGHVDPWPPVRPRRTRTAHRLPGLARRRERQRRHRGDPHRRHGLPEPHPDRRMRTSGDRSGRPTGGGSPTRPTRTARRSSS